MNHKPHPISYYKSIPKGSHFFSIYDLSAVVTILTLHHGSPRHVYGCRVMITNRQVTQYILIPGGSSNTTPDVYKHKRIH